MSKLILEKNSNEDSISRGVHKLAEIVGDTLGPAGKTILIRKLGRPVIATKDGVSVAKEVEFKDEGENLGVSLVREVSSKTDDLAGDGTTTATVLASAILSNLRKVNPSYNVNKVLRGVEYAKEAVLEKLSEMKMECDPEMLESVATISANNDQVLGKMISDCILKVGAYGNVIPERSLNGETTHDIKLGMTYDRGYGNIPGFCTDRSRMIIELDNPLVLITDERITSSRQIKDVMEFAFENKRSLFIIADDVADEALATLLANSMKGLLRIGISKAPGFSNDRIESMIDMACMVGATAIVGRDSLKLDGNSVKFLGEADKVVVSKNETSIIKESVTIQMTDRINFVKSELESAGPSSMEQLRTRLARLTGGVATIQVGGSSEVEVVEKLHRIQDAINATRAALMDGIVLGGGATLKFIKHELGLSLLNDSEPEFEEGFKAVVGALDAPYKRILLNAGIENHAELHQAYNALTGKISNLWDEGIVDPVKVTKTAFTTACSVAGIISTTSYAIIEEEYHNE